MDTTENIRRGMVQEINSTPRTREDLKEEYPEVWNTGELTKRFIVKSFLAPFAVVEDRKTGITGVVMFQDRPRFYFDFVPA